MSELELAIIGRCRMKAFIFSEITSVIAAGLWLPFLLLLSPFALLPTVSVFTTPTNSQVISCATIAAVVRGKFF